MTRIEISRELIAAGRRALATKYHPDAGGDAEQMSEVNAAADWLIEGLPFRPHETSKFNPTAAIEHHLLVCHSIAAELRQLQFRAGSMSHNTAAIEELAKRLETMAV